MSIDPKLTWMVYIGGAVIFLSVLTILFVYTSKMKTRKAVLDSKGRVPVSREEGIAIATEGVKHDRNL